jgi:hypothetical protein
MGLEQKRWRTVEEREVKSDWTQKARAPQARQRAQMGRNREAWEKEEEERFR